MHNRWCRRTLEKEVQLQEKAMNLNVNRHMSLDLKPSKLLRPEQVQPGTMCPMHEPSSCPAEVLRTDPVALATQPQEPEAQVAREASPGHHSVAGYSEFSAMECGAVKAEDDRELVPVQPEATDPMLRVLMQDQQSLVE